MPRRRTRSVAFSPTRAAHSISPLRCKVSSTTGQTGKQHPPPLPPPRSVMQARRERFDLRARHAGKGRQPSPQTPHPSPPCSAPISRAGGRSAPGRSAVRFRPLFPLRRRGGGGKADRDRIRDHGEEEEEAAVRLGCLLPTPTRHRHDSPAAPSYTGGYSASSSPPSPPPT